MSKVVKNRVPNFGTRNFRRLSRSNRMMDKNQSGFSLLEVLIVLVVIGIIVGLASPGLLKSKQLAENENAHSTLRSIVSSQFTHYSTNGRFARLDELNQAHNNGLGATSGANLLRGKFTFSMNPAVPSDDVLRNSFHITVTKAGNDGGVPYTLDVDETGRIIEPFGSVH